MALENVAKLFRAAQEDQDLRNKLNQAPNLEMFIAMAEDHGYHFTVEEWKEMTGFKVEELEGELSEIPGL